MIRLLKGAFSRHPVVRVRLSARIEATIYDRPGLWMDDAELSRLRKDVRTISDAAIPGQLNYGVFLPERAPYANRLIVIARADGDTIPVGFNAMPRLQVTIDRGEAGPKTLEVLHLGLVAIHPSYQRQGLQGLLYGLGGFSAFHRMPERPVWLSSVTEVPAIFGAVADNFLDVYPSFRDPRPAPAEHRQIALAIMKHHRHEFGVGPEACFDADRFVIEGSYTGGSDALKKSFETAPHYRVAGANDYCQRQLDYSRGDDFLQIGKMDTEVITGWLSNRIPADLRPAAARQMKLWTYPQPKARIA